MNLADRDQKGDAIFKLVDKMLNGSVRALGKLITLVEEEVPLS